MLPPPGNLSERSVPTVDVYDEARYSLTAIFSDAKVGLRAKNHWESSKVVCRSSFFRRLLQEVTMPSRLPVELHPELMPQWGADGGKKHMMEVHMRSAMPP